MSQAPINKLPKRTFVLIKDLIFQERYRLSHTQTDIMAYILNSITWSLSIEGFRPITTNKFLTDLPQISVKTLEESLRVLKNMDLIEVKMIKVPQWKNEPTVRGIRITAKGMEYNQSYYKADEKDVINSLQADLHCKELEIEELRAKVDALSTKEDRDIVEQFNKKAQSQPVAEPKPQTQPVEQPKEEKTPQQIAENQARIDNLLKKALNRTVDEPTKKESPKLEESKESQLEKQALKEAKVTQEEIDERYKDLTYEETIDVVTREYGKTAKPICNNVKGWYKECTFYINSYGKLSIFTQNGDLFQMKDPRDISRFWEYLHKNPHKIGKVRNFHIPLTIQELNREYVGKTIKIGDKKPKINKIVKAEGYDDKVKIQIAQGDKTGYLQTTNRNNDNIVYVIDRLECERVLSNLMVL